MRRKKTIVYPPIRRFPFKRRFAERSEQARKVDVLASLVPLIQTPAFTYLTRFLPKPAIPGSLPRARPKITPKYFQYPQISFPQIFHPTYFQMPAPQTRVTGKMAADENEYKYKLQLHSPSCSSNRPRKERRKCPLRMRSVSAVAWKDRKKKCTHVDNDRVWPFLSAPF